MTGLQPIFKKAYWSLAAGGLLYLSIIFSLTQPVAQRLYVQYLSTVSGIMKYEPC